MNNFWTLVSLEYKKLLYKKTIIIAIMVTLIFSLFASGIIGLIDKMETESGEKVTIHENYKREKSLILELNGRIIDKELILEASKHYDENPIMYNEVYKIVASGNPDLTIDGFKNFSEKEASLFYENRTKTIEETFMESDDWNDKQMEKVLLKSKEVKTPYEFNYMYGYKKWVCETFSVNSTSMINF